MEENNTEDGGLLQHSRNLLESYIKIGCDQQPSFQNIMPLECQCMTKFLAN